MNVLTQNQVLLMMSIQSHGISLKKYKPVCDPKYIFYPNCPLAVVNSKFEFLAKSDQSLVCCSGTGSLIPRPQESIESQNLIQSITGKV